jgi:membrane protein DedA with SNARE-associated domain
MTETIPSLLAAHGAAILLAITFLASLALPLPASFALLAAGALTATADLSLPAVASAALTGAVTGDLAAYGIGRWGGARIWERLSQRPRVGRMLNEAGTMLHRHAGQAVLLSRWPFSPLGPYVNAVSGATRLPFGQFATLVAIGNAVWIGLYVGLGHVFAARVKDVGNLLSLVATGLALLVVAIIVIRWSRGRAS